MLPMSIGNIVTKLFILVLGLLFLLPPAFKLCNYSVFRLHAISVDGIITDASRGRDMGGRPIVEYKDLHGKSYEKKSKVKTHWFYKPKVGEKVKILYDEHDPNIAIVDNTFHYIILPMFFIAVGFCCLLHGLRSQLNETGKAAGGPTRST